MAPVRLPVRHLAVACAVSAVAAVTACGESSVDEPTGPTDTIPPAVIELQPAPLEQGVQIEATVLVRFSEPINTATVGPASFLVRKGFDSVPGAYTFGDSSVGFVPTDDLAPSSSYSVTLRRGIRDPAGNQLANDTAWAFQTRSQGTPTPPRR